MRDGNVPRFFVRQGATGGPSWWDSSRDQLADPANPANPSFSGKEDGRKEGREKEEREEEGERGGWGEGGYLLNK